MRNCPNCSGEITEKKNSKGMVNFQCVSGLIDDATGKVCKANGYLRHEGKQKTETGTTQGELGQNPPPVTPQPPAQPEPTPAPTPAVIRKKRREPKRNDKPATPARTKRTFDFD